MRWKALAFLGKIEESKHKQNYGFLTRNCPAVVKELTVWMRFTTNDKKCRI